MDNSSCLFLLTNIWRRSDKNRICNHAHSSYAGRHVFEKYGGLFTSFTIIIYTRALSSRSIVRRAFKRPRVNKTGMHRLRNRTTRRIIGARFARQWFDRSISYLDLCDNGEDSPLGKFRWSAAVDSFRIPGGFLSSSLQVKFYCLPRSGTFLSVHEPRFGLLSLHCHLPYRAASSPRPSRR